MNHLEEEWEMFAVFMRHNVLSDERILPATHDAHVLLVEQVILIIVGRRTSGRFKS